MTGPLSAPLLLLAILAVTLTMTLAMTLAKNSKRVGAIEEADVKDQDMQRALDFAILKYKEKSNDSYYSRVRQIVKILQEAIAEMYSFYVEIIRNTCNKSQPNLDNCPSQEQPNLKTE
uniref:Cystatin domain-containing protein n=1 Tax=Microcebus murinus TaxID=30608 RepID=A0A8B7GBI6_MICMU|nr:cystatin-C-like [Microcebus murinus]